MNGIAQDDRVVWHASLSETSGNRNDEAVGKEISLFSYALLENLSRSFLTSNLCGNKTRQDHVLITRLSNLNFEIFDFSLSPPRHVDSSELELLPVSPPARNTIFAKEVRVGFLCCYVVDVEPWFCAQMIATLLRFASSFTDTFACFCLALSFTGF